MTEMILVGDVGGTNVRFAQAVREGNHWTVSAFGRFANDDHPQFDDALSAYLSQAGVKPSAACFAFAGPVQAGEVKLTNRNWTARESDLQHRFGIQRVLLINDFAAMARAVPEYKPSDLEIIRAGVAVEGTPILVTGPGTGLGVATLLKTAAGYRVLSGEGGHTAYAPRTRVEFELATVLMRHQAARGEAAPYVSNELVCSGSGLADVYTAMCEIFGREEIDITPQDMRVRADEGDEMFRTLIEIRANCVMGAAGDLALTNGARGGVVLAGGVTERILDFLKRPEADARFASRGKMSAYLENCPVAFLSDAKAPLIGAAAYFQQEMNTSAKA